MVPLYIIQIVTLEAFGITHVCVYVANYPLSPCMLNDYVSSLFAVVVALPWVNQFRAVEHSTHTISPGHHNPLAPVISV